MLTVWSSGATAWAGTLVLPRTSDGYLETRGTTSSFYNGTGPGFYGDFYMTYSDQRSAGMSGVAGLDFDLSFIPAGTTITAATLNLVVAGSEGYTRSPTFHIHNFADSNSKIEQSDLLAFPTMSDATFVGFPIGGAPPGSLQIPITHDVTSFVQSVVNGGTPAAGFELWSEQSEVVVWGSGSGATAPTLTIVSSVNIALTVPEPASLLMLGSGMAGVAALAWCRSGAPGVRRPGPPGVPGVRRGK
jgi:hypothetical protein